MQISIPLGLLSGALSWLRKKLFLPTYEISDSIWTSRHSLGSHWTDVYGHFEYSIYFPQMTDPEEYRTTRMALRSNNNKIEKIVLVVEAFSKLCRFQHSLSLHEVGPVPLVVTLHGIPYQQVEFDDSKGGIRFMWNQYFIDIKELFFSDKSEVKPFRTLTSALTHTWFLNSEWEQINGIYYNVDAIRDAKVELRQKLLYEYQYISLTPRSITQLAILYMNFPVKWILATKLCLWIQFWFPVWFRMKILDKEGGFVGGRGRVGPTLTGC